MVPLPTLGNQTGNQIAQALPVGQLPKDHAHQLVPVGELPDFIVASVSLDTLKEIVRIQKRGYLSENILTLIHPAKLCHHGSRRKKHKRFKSFELASRLNKQYYRYFKELFFLILGR